MAEQRDAPTDVEIRMVAVEAAARRLGPTPQTDLTGRDAAGLASEEIVIAAGTLTDWIKTGRINY